MKLVNKSLYLQARDEILKMIETEFSVMQKLPSEQELANRFGVSRNTIREAIKSLENQGILASRQGIGTFLISSHSNVKTNIATLTSATKLIEDQGYTPGTLCRFTEIRKPSAEIAEALGIRETDDILYLERVRTADGKPVIFVQDYIRCTEGLEQSFREHTDESLVQLLRRIGVTISFSTCRISSVISSDSIEQKMQLNEKKALTLLKQMHFSDLGQPAFFSDSYFLSDMFEFYAVRKLYL